MKGGRFTILLVVRQVIVEDKVLDTLLLFAFGLLLRAHSDGERRVRGEINRAGLPRLLAES